MLALIGGAECAVTPLPAYTILPDGRVQTLASSDGTFSSWLLPPAVGAAARLGDVNLIVSSEADGEGRGLHSFTSRLNLSALYGIGGARRDCVAHVQGMLGGV